MSSGSMFGYLDTSCLDYTIKRLENIRRNSTDDDGTSSIEMELDSLAHISELNSRVNQIKTLLEQIIDEHKKRNLNTGGRKRKKGGRKTRRKTCKKKYM